MSKTSLSSSIFGGKDIPAPADPTLSTLFAPTPLAEKPNKLNFTETTADRAKRERKEHKRKKRQSKHNDESEDGEKETTVALTKGGDTSDTGNNVVGMNEEERTVFVGNLPSNTTRKSLAAIFKSCGNIQSTRIRSIATAGVKVAPEHKGNQNLVKKVSVNTLQVIDNPKKTSQGYVVFEKLESIEKALKLNNTPVTNTELLLRVDRAKPCIDSTRSVFVGGLPYKAEEMSVREHFNSGCGFESDVIENVRIIRDPSTMQCKGFGYILLKDKSYVPYALEMHDSLYKDRQIRVLVCGKRFKGKRGAEKEGDKLSGAERRLLKNKPSNNTLLATGKEKKKRGVKKIGPKKAGTTAISKRAASEKKVEKRVRKLQKREKRGMGKTKKY